MTRPAVGTGLRMRRSGEPGARWVARHPVGGMWFAYAVCAAMVGLATAQLVVRWQGLLSGVSAAVGLIVAVSLLRAYAVAAAHHRTERAVALLQLGSALGAAAVIPTFFFLGVSQPGPVLGVAQAAADGYIVGLFAGMVFFVRRPKPSDSGTAP